ncbi:MAG: hypothetical protein M1838_003916 [Thelocarpon superellum]|nr:MAG: hypothetical protein M1838_003916 [Thelocarpon superellum]
MLFFRGILTWTMLLLMRGSGGHSRHILATKGVGGFESPLVARGGVCLSTDDLKTQQAVVIRTDDGDPIVVPTYATEEASAAGRALLQTASRALAPVPAGLSVVFLVIDIRKHDTKGTTFAAVGLAIGLIALVDQPTGWVLGAILVLIMAAADDLKNQEAAPRNNATQIINLQMFGQKDGSPNDPCAAHGNVTCYASYGPATISQLFGWSTFEAVVFLIHFNQGCAMTVAQMAKAFYVNDPKVANDGMNQVATIDCHNGKASVDRGGEVYGDLPQNCAHPTFSIKKQLITLPLLNQTADRIEPRIIPNPGGDCLVYDTLAQPEYRSELNVTLVGNPVAITCGLVAAVNNDGVLQPLGRPVANASVSVNGTTVDGTTGETAALISQLLAAGADLGGAAGDSGNSSELVNSLLANASAAGLISSNTSSTDGASGHYIAPPSSPPPWQPVDESSMVFLGDGNDTFGLPNGTYRSDTRSFGFAGKAINTLSVPAGGSLSFFWGTNDGRPVLRNPRPKFTSAQTASDHDFVKGMAWLRLWDTKTFDVVVPHVSSSVCLFTEVNFGGQYLCVSAGGGNVTDDIRNKAKSISINNGLRVYIFPDYYGALGERLLTSSQADLSAVALGNGDFSERIGALWIDDGTGMNATGSGIGVDPGNVVFDGFGNPVGQGSAQNSSGGADVL